MSRNTGPRLRLVRRLGTMLPGLTRKSTERRPYPPGQHPSRYRRRVSDYAVRLAEKQKLRYHYGLTETQFRNSIRKAFRMPGSPGENLAQLLELRLDNVAFRLGFAPTIPAARQLVRHRHVFVNGRKVNFPSFLVSEGDQISVTNSDHPSILEGIQRGPQIALPSYLERAQDGMSGKCKALPLRSDIPIDFEERLVVEFYAAR